VAASVSLSAQPGSDLPRDLVDEMSALYSLKANLRTIQAQDEMMGTLLDAHA